MFLLKRRGKSTASKHQEIRNGKAEVSARGSSKAGDRDLGDSCTGDCRRRRKEIRAEDPSQPVVDPDRPKQTSLVATAVYWPRDSPSHPPRTQPPIDMTVYMVWLSVYLGMGVGCVFDTVKQGDMCD